ncbi:MAG: DEAD/DEAH box helicase [Alphaproteobacteria bacterium]|nr:DEAD/DEAH box helicase [Alphaproteobacteria bacterium]
MLKPASRVELNDRFRDALQRMEYSDRSLFITGRAGTGKSTLLSHFCARTGKHPVVLAPTGVAALNVRGQTIHKFFHFYTDVTPDKIRRHKIRPRNPKLYKKLNTIIIDEISMVRADLLDCIDVFLRLYGPDETRPFGGVQMIFVGDLYQLPPVVSRESEAIFREHYETPYFFSAHCLREADFSIIELDRIYRQKEQDFVELLNRIRTDSATDTDLAYLNRRFLPSHEPDTARFFITLTTTNAKADEINASHLAALPGRVHTSHAVISGDFGREYYPTAPELHFKIGAQIMLTNNDAAGRWVNGSLGVITAIRRDEQERAYVEVKLDDEETRVQVYPHAWEVFRYAIEGGQLDAQPAGTFTQLPFRLAWAVTIHKSQGKTFDHVMIDVDRGTFAAGQMYVALSRCTTFEGMVLKTRIAAHHIRTDARIVDFLAAHPYVPAPTTLAEDDPLLANDAPPSPEKPATTDRLARARATLRPLTEGRHPITGAALAAGDACTDPKIIGALVALLDASAGIAPAKAARGRARADAPNHGKAWDDAERKRAATAYEAGTPLKEIAQTHGRTSGSIRGELIRQGLIEFESA